MRIKTVDGTYIDEQKDELTDLMTEQLNLYAIYIIQSSIVHKQGLNDFRESWETMAHKHLDIAEWLMTENTLVDELYDFNNFKYNFTKETNFYEAINKLEDTAYKNIISVKYNTENLYIKEIIKEVSIMQLDLMHHIGHVYHLSQTVNPDEGLLEFGAYVKSILCKK